MGLLAKAGKEGSEKKAASSLLARAREAREVASRDSDFASGPEELQALTAELKRLPDSIDSVIVAWVRITSAVPLPRLCLFLRRGSGLMPAATRGFSPRAGTVPQPKAGEIGEAGSPMTGAFGDAVSELLGFAHRESLRTVPLERSGELLGLWVYPDLRAGASDPSIRSRLAGLLGSVAALPSVGLRLAEPLIQPSLDLVSSLSGFKRAAAFRLDLDPIFAALEAPYAGVAPLTLASAIEVAARKILGSSGSARLIGLRTLASVLGSIAPVDSELACFQFTKSLKRSLAFLGPVRLTAGSSCTLDPAARDAEEKLARFLAE
jgi:hypothetical protein